MSKPKAYINVDLDAHLASVGEAVALVGREILSVQTPVAKKVDSFTKVKNSLFISSVLAGAFHDIGKASNYYQKSLESFYLHEYISGIVLHSIARSFLEEEKDSLACIFNLSAWSAVRHHVAMIERHPISIISGNDVMKLLDAITQFDVDVAKEGLPDVVKKSKLYDKVIDSFMQLRNIPKDKVKKMVLEEVNALVKINEKTPMSCNLNKDCWISAVEIVTGPVIMADILVSEIERKRSDDDTDRIYSKYWKQELEIENELKNLMSGKREFSNLKKFISEVEKLI